MVSSTRRSSRSTSRAIGSDSWSPSRLATTRSASPATEASSATAATRVGCAPEAAVRTGGRGSGPLADHTVFGVNPASDNGATGKRWPELAHRAAQLGLEGETLFSERPGHLIELAAPADAGLVVSVGGDGTLNETVNGLMERQQRPVLATIPLGTGM